MTSYNLIDIPAHLNVGHAVVNPAVFVFAHQDDETLTFGAEIAMHKAAGRYCIGVCATDGRSSGARTILGLDIPTFVRARNLELMSAASELGLDELYLQGGQDAGLTSVHANAIATFWYNRYPSGSFKVPSDRDDNVDHKALGVAFRGIKNIVGSAGDIRFYVKPEQRATIPGLNTTAAPNGGASVKAAAAEYGRDDSANGRYAVGYHSVPDDFNALAAGAPVSTWHF